MTYKVWVSIEEYEDEDTLTYDICELIPYGEFETAEEAQNFVDLLLTEVPK